MQLGGSIVPTAVQWIPPQLSLADVFIAAILEPAAAAATHDLLSRAGFCQEGKLYIRIKLYMLQVGLDPP